MTCSLEALSGVAYIVCPVGEVIAMIFAMIGADTGKSGTTICVTAEPAGKGVMLVAVTVFAGRGIVVWPV